MIRICRPPYRIMCPTAGRISTDLSFTGRCRHQTVQLGILGNGIDEWDERAAHTQKPVSGLGVGDIAHLLVGDVQELRELGTVGKRLIEHNHELGVGEHGARLHGIQQVVG